MAKTSGIPRLMIVTGDDGFAMETAMIKYLERIRAERGEVLIEHFDSAGESMGSFLARAMTASLFQEVRVFCVLHAQTLTEAELKALDEALDYEIPDVYMFIGAEIESKKPAEGKSEAKVGKALQLKKREGNEAIVVQNHTKPPEYKLAEWIEAQVPELFGRQIGRAEAELLADTVDYNRLYSELQKIDTALPAGARIDQKIIKDIIGSTRAISVFELAAALGKRDLPTALKALDSLFTGDFYAPLAVSAIFKHFWSLLKIKKYIETNPQIIKQYNTRGYGKDSPQSMAALEIGRACGLLPDKDSAKNMVYPVIIKSGVVEQSQKFTTAGLRGILKTLQQFDAGIKTGKTEPTALNLQMLCYKIATAA